MAASMQWRSRLKDCPIFNILRQGGHDGSGGGDSKNLIATKDGCFFVWNAYRSCILTTNLKQLAHQSDRAEAGKCQTLRLTVPPVFEVDSISVNETGQLLAVWGKRGLYVVELPQRCGKHAEFSGGKEKILCKTIPIGERYFISASEKLLHMAWHPGSLTDSHLMVLTSDCTLRIYNVCNPAVAEHTYRLPNVSGISLSSLSCTQALGDTAVSFDFGSPHTHTAKPQLFADPSDKKVKDETVDVWPVYVLWATGEVYYLETCLVPGNKHLNLESRISGPLAMYPPAEDNYGTDACAILCLQSRPPVIVIATAEGKLYHSVVLRQDSQADADSKSLCSTTEEDDGADITLYVYESVELELSLTTVSLETDEPIPDMFTCPIRLHKDGGAVERYHCSHSAGAHSIVLPWMNQIQKFCDNDTEADKSSPVSPDNQAIVEHLICTKPLQSSPPSPVLGVTVVTDILLGTTLLCLTQAFSCITLPLLQQQSLAAPSLLCEQPLRDISSPLKRLHREPFDQHIQRLLQRATCNPILRGSEQSALSAQECFQLLSRATQVFREQYIQKQNFVKEEIDRRVRVLADQLQQQQDDLLLCLHSKNILTDSAHGLADKHQMLLDQQHHLIDRLETILRKLQTRLPSLSNAERKMQRDLQEMDDVVRSLDSTIKQLKKKQRYQEGVISQSGCTTKTSTPTFSKTQTQQLKTVIKEEGDDIAELVKKINHLKINLKS